MRKHLKCETAQVHRLCAQKNDKRLKLTNAIIEPQNQYSFSCRAHKYSSYLFTGFGPTFMPPVSVDQPVPVPVALLTPAPVLVGILMSLLVVPTPVPTAELWLEE